MSTVEAKKVDMEIVATKSSSKEADARIPKIHERLTSELVIALVGPVGSGCTTTSEELKKTLSRDYRYEVCNYKLSEFIQQSASLVGVDPHQLKGLPPAERVKEFQNAGDSLRKQFGGAYLAAKAIESIANNREKEGFDTTVKGEPLAKGLRRVHIIDSIKHTEELELLRQTYGEIFWLIGVFAPTEIRKQRLTMQQSLLESDVDSIIRRDYREGVDHGQNVRDVFHKSDFFLRNDQDNRAGLERDIERFLEVIFGYPVHTPNLEESSMYAAHAEAARSACLSRQVGAAIVSANGELIGLGRNDVPKYGGGLYTEDDGSCDHRCHRWLDKGCHNDRKKNDLYDQIFQVMLHDGLLAPDVAPEKVKAAVKATDVKSLIEYSRAVHAEMDAITSVARNQKAGLVGGTLYSTTFPCHSCARHIVASGIHKVIFIEPYPKSLATELHRDAITEISGDSNKRVLFQQFSGIAPKNILKLFNIGLTRKGRDGKIAPFDKSTASPIVNVSLDDYSTHEKLVIADLMTREQERESHAQ